jgi:hypothetical protein
MYSERWWWKVKQIRVKLKLKRTVELIQINFLELVIVKFVYSYSCPPQPKSFESQVLRKWWKRSLELHCKIEAFSTWLNGCTNFNWFMLLISRRLIYMAIQLSQSYANLAKVWILTLDKKNEVILIQRQREACLAFPSSEFRYGRIMIINQTWNIWYFYFFCCSCCEHFVS